MLETPHVALGLAIATKIPNPFISIPLAFASHFLLEIVPHWNPHLNGETKKYGRPSNKTTLFVFADSTTALVFGTYAALALSTNNYHLITILACCFASVLPDLLEAPYFFLGFRQKFFTKWIALQKSIQTDANMFWGISTQVITLVSAIIWILN